MSSVEQNEFVKTVVWSNGNYKLEELVARFELPQLVRVEVGFCTVNERTSLASGQVIMLHCVRKTQKLICETPLKNALLIPLDCPVDVLVQPRANECKYMQVSAGQLPSLRAECGHIKYVFALEGYLNIKSPNETIELGEIFELGDVDKKECSVKCKNVANGKSLSIKADFNVLFAPLLDFRRYTLTEVKQTFGFPAQVHFMDDNSGGSTTSSGSNSSMLVSRLDTVTVADEITQTVVISTALGGSGVDNVSLQIPNELPIQVAIVKGFIPGKEHNRGIVETLEKQLSSRALESSQNLDTYEDLDTASTTIHEMSFKQPSDEIRISKFDYGPAPTLPLRRVSQTETSPQLSRRQGPPVFRKPKLIPTPKPSPGLRPKPSPAKPTVLERSSERKSSTIPGMSKSPMTKMPAVDERGYVELNRKAWTLKTASRSDSDYDCAASPLDTCEGQHIYAEIPYKSTVPPDRHVHPVCPRGGGGGENRATARFPTDLCGLSVSEIAELLSELNMACYKEVFQKELVDGEMLNGLDEESLESLGVDAFHIKKLMMFIDGWRPNF